MNHFVTFLTLILYFMFLKASLLNAVNIQCKVWLSGTMYTLNCKSEWSHHIFSMKRNANHDNITIKNLSSITDLFFSLENNFKVVSFQCGYETMLVEVVLQEVVLQNHCIKINTSLIEFQNLLGKFSITELEVFNFVTPVIQLEYLSSLLSLSIRDNILGNHLEKNLTFPSSLTHLAITDNDFQSISKDLFVNLKSLIDLDLSGNDLQVIDLETFKNMGNLRKLDLSNNFLNTKIFPALYPLTQLETLIFSRNIIGSSDYDRNVFNLKLSNLKYLDYSNCHVVLSDVFQDGDIFQGLKLRHLDLSKNYLYSPPITVFWNLAELEYLDLNTDEINFLHEKSFKDLSMLQFLDLSHNNLKTVNEFYFEKLFSMITLNISFNSIENLNQNIFQNMNNLTVIDIKNNTIELFDVSILRYQKTLHSLDASQNRLIEITNSETVDININYVNFSYNQITHFASLQQFLPKLKSLKLDHNKIENLDFWQELACFTNLTHSIFVSLTHNRISNFYVFKCINEKQYIESNNITNCLHYDSHVYMDLSFNPLQCDCQLYPLYNYVKECPKLFQFINLQDVKCQSPYFLKNHEFQSVPDETFSCLFPEKCPAHKVEDGFEIENTLCDCGIRAKDYKVFVNCTNQGLYKVFEEPPFDTSILFFQQNKLKNLSSLNSKHWMGLTDIHVDDNDIGTLEEWIIPPKLRFLSLRGNRLRSLSRGVSEYILTRDNFDLFFGGNDRNCDCESEDLKKFLIAKPEFVKDVENIICDYEEEGKIVSEQLLSIPSYILCSEQFASRFAQNSLIYGFSTLFLTSFVAITAYIKMRFVIHSFLYIHCNKFCCFKPYDSDSEDKLFDAFVAYSGNDRQIVLELLDELENGEPRFRLCIHERDWLPGQFIYENILNSVQNSKRTIIVMSDDFVVSPWFKVELNAAMSKDQMNPFIVILADKSFNLNNIDKHFCRVISKKTYLIWGERWFWEKLRYAMPHKKDEGLETYV